MVSEEFYVFIHRKQTVVLGVENSDEVVVLSGSVFGPCLFIFYINDIPLALKSKVRLLIDDDTTMYLFRHW